METKKFYLTSEFWISVASIITVLSGAIPHLSDKTKATLATATAAAYALARGLAKSGTTPTDEPME